MAGKESDRVSQRIDAARDAYTAGRDQFITHVYAGGEDPVVPGLLPRDVPGFTGREDELERLEAMAGGGRVVVMAIGGAAGAGKTALAVHAAHRLLPGFPDGQLYADLRGYTVDQAPAEPDEVLEVFLRSLGVTAEKVPEKTAERSGMLRGLLASRRVLVLLDNARSEEQVEPLLPGTGESLVLVTSRSPLTGLSADARLMLDALPDDDAALLLAELAEEARTKAEPEAAARVLEYCGGLPLALRIAGQLLAAHPSWPVAKLEGMLADEKGRLEQLKAGDLQVRAPFEVSYRQLEAPDARLFRLLGLSPAPDFGPGPAAALAGITEAEAEMALGRLAEACLVTEDRAGRFGMHDLLRLFARDACHAAEGEADREAAEIRLVTWYVELAGVLDSCIDPELRPAAEEAPGRRGAVLPSPREALALFSVERRGLMAVADLAARREQDDLLMRLSESAGDAMIMLRYLDDLLLLRQTALAAARRARYTVGEGSALNNLGVTYRELRRFGEAVTSHKQALTIFREIGDRRCEGMALGNLGNAYRILGRIEEAVTCYEQDIAICQEVGDRRGEGSTLTSLGVAYQGWGRFEEAVTCHQQALEIFEEVGDQQREGMALGNLGNACRSLGGDDEADACYEQALTIFREVGDRHSEGMALSNLGSIYRNLGRYEAVTCYEQALTIFQELGDRHDEGRALSSLGDCYLDLRQPERAGALWRDAAIVMRKAGDEEAAAYMKKRAADASSVRPRWWNRWRRR